MKWILILIAMSLSLPAWSHPVAFQDSVGIMGHHSPTLSHNQVNYSYRYWLAPGIHYFKRPDLTDNNSAVVTSANFLLKRWNTDRFQANLYAGLGFGWSEFSGTDRGVGLGFAQFDIEDRKYYFLVKHEHLGSSNNDDLKMSKVRLGLAPYVGDYEDLHSWIILEWGRKDFSQGDVSEDLTPMLRLFYRNLLFEIGQSFDGETKFNYIAHF